MIQEERTQKNINTDLALSRVGLGLIFCYCVAASLWGAPFAQIHLPLHSLPFPIFVGEILLFICLLLFLSVSEDAKLFDRRSMVLLGLYFGWVFLKGLINYSHDGPLTCRNAALFYYPVFAVFAYCFYQQAQIPRKVLMSLALPAAGILFFKVMGDYYWWTYVTLFAIAVWNTKSVKWRWLGLLFLAVIFLLGKEYLYQGSRSHFVSVFGAVVFLVFYFGALLAKRRHYAILNILLVSFLFFIIGFFVFSNRNAVSSVTSLKGMINTFQEFDRAYQDRQVGFVPRKLSVHLYNPKNSGDHFITSESETFQPAITQPVITVPETPQPVITASSVRSQPKVATTAVSQPAVTATTASQAIASGSGRIWEGRSLEVNQENIVFRLFIWRDMARELIKEPKAWLFGFSFGHPQRSRYLEVLNMGTGDWSRDGWITPHNSFFHIIYRAGILGVFLIGVLFFMMRRLAGDFFKMNSIEGGLLVGALVYWLVLSNFLVILEFPYNAIIFWTLFGITWAYRDGLLKTKH